MKKYILYFVSGLTFIFLVVASLLIYEGVYLQYKPLSNLINIDEIEKVDLKYYDDSLNESIISLNNEKKELYDGFKNVVELLFEDNDEDHNFADLPKLKLL